MLLNNHIPVERSKQAIYKKYRDLKKNQKPLRNFINKLDKEKLDLQKEKVDLEAVLKKEKEENEVLLKDMKIVKDMNNKLEEQLSKLATPDDNFKAVFENLEEKRKTDIYSLQASSVEAMKTINAALQSFLKKT
jgi:predicted nuclease with TOPRIM domain